MAQHYHDADLADPNGPYSNNGELIDTFSVEEDMDSSCQGLLTQDSAPLFDSSPLLSNDDESAANSTSTFDLVSFGVTVMETTSAPKSLERKTTGESKPASLESLDSIRSHHVDDEESLETAKVANTAGTNISDAMLGEHVNFLKGHTQPRTLEVAWKTSDTPSPPTEK